MLTTPTRHGRPGDRESGFALVSVIASMFVLTMLATAGLYYVTGQLPVSRQTQDAAASVAAAQAGLDDFIQHLNSCDTYWTPSTCPGGRPSYYVTGQRPTATTPDWQVIPGTSAGTSVGPSSFQYSVVQSPDVSGGNLRVRVSGRTNGETRTITADLSKDSFLKYIYYTDLETFAPDVYRLSHKAGWATLSYSGSSYALPDTTSHADECGIYHYAGRSGITDDLLGTKTAGSGASTHLFNDVSVCTDINFVGGDTLAGWLHTNDSIKLGGSANFVRIKSTDAVESSWASAPVVAGVTHINPGANLWWDGSYAPGTCAGCMTPSYAGSVVLPPDNQKLVEYADPLRGGTGCLYTGPTKITFRSNGTYDVRSPYSKVVNPGCGTGPFGAGTQTVNGPPNGVIFVQPRPTLSTDPNYSAGACTPGVVGYPVASDITTTYTCDAGDAFVSGTVKGRLTVGAANNVVIVDDVLYNSGTGPGSTDVLGLIGNNFVQVYHPVDASGNNLLPVSSLEIDAAILAIKGSFIVQNWAYGTHMGTLSLHGALGQKFRGTVGTVSSGSCTSGNGYCKDYQYDTRFPLQSPPFFLDPVSARWKKNAVAEQRN